MKKYPIYIILLLFYCSLLACKPRIKPEETFSVEELLPKDIKKTSDSLKQQKLTTLNPAFCIKKYASFQNKYSADSLVTAYINLRIGSLYSELRAFDKVIEHTSLAINYFKYHISNGRKEYISCLTTLSSTFVEINDNQQALTFLKQAEDQSRLIDTLKYKCQYQGSMSVLNSVAAYVMELTNNDPQRLRYQLKSAYYRLRSNKKDSVYISALLYNVAVTYECLNRLDSANFYLKKSKAYIQNNNFIMIMEYDRMISRLFTRKNQLDSSIYYAEKSFSLFRGAQYVVNNDIAVQLATNYNKIHNEQQSEKYYQLAKKTFFSDTASNYPNKENIITGLFNLAVKKKKIKDIDILNKAFLKVIKTNYSIQQEKALQSAEVLYRIKVKHADVEKLAIESELKSTANRERIWIILGISIALIIIIYFYFRQIKLKQERNAIDLEQRLLLTQMNPHFMSNALSAIQKEIYEGKTDLAINYLNKYSSLNRLILENSRKKHIHLDEELKILENYIALQQIRFAIKFDYRFELADGLEDLEIQIPCMLIQPFIENAIEHGFKNLKYKGLLIVKMYEVDACLRCEIIDNGSGISSSEAKQTKQSHSFIIACQRLALLEKQTGKLSTFSIANRSDGLAGVVVSLQIPYITNYD